MSEKLITELLKKVNYPGFSRDIVSFGLVNEAKLENDNAVVKIELNSTDPSLPRKLKNKVSKMVVNQMKMRHPLLQMSKESLQLPAGKGVLENPL